jgi:hypothetical protein
LAQGIEEIDGGRGGWLARLRVLLSIVSELVFLKNFVEQSLELLGAQQKRVHILSRHFVSLEFPLFVAF